MDNQVQPQESLLQPTPPPTLKRLRFKTLHIIIFIIVLCIISLSSTTYLLMANNKEVPILKSVPQTTLEIPSFTPFPTKIISKPTITLTPTLTPTLKLPSTSLKTDPTASWSAFTSTKYSYSIKYPPLWTAQTITQQDPKILEYVVFNPVATKAGTLSITLSYGTRTNKEALALDPQIGESMIVASVSATKKNSKDSNGYKATNVIVPFGSNTIVFNAKDAFASLFNQMLTTLKLTK